MQTILKFPLHPGHNTVPMPEGTETLDVQFQEGDRLALWALAPHDHPLEYREFVVLRTGDEVGDEIGGYLGTAQTDSGLVFHVFECYSDTDETGPEG